MYIVMIEDSQLLLFLNGYWDTWDGQVNIEIWYFEVTFGNIFLLIKHEILLKSKLSLCISQRFISNFRINKILSYASALPAFVPSNLLLLYLYSPILNIFIFLRSSSLNRLNALSPCHKLEPIGNAQNLSSSFICGDKHSTPTSLIKVPSTKVGVYLILHDQNTLFTDPN